VAIVHGYNAQGFYLVQDPALGSGFATYAFLMSAYRSGRWSDSWGRFKRE
jgi:hypothetical protein